MILTYQYRLLPTKRQHRALESILESQRLLYNAALEERIGAYRRGVVLGFTDQCKGLTEWRRTDPSAHAVPQRLQRATLRRVDRAYAGFFRRLRQKGAKAGFPRFRGKGRWESFGFDEINGIHFNDDRLTFVGMPGSLKVHLHRPLPDHARLLLCFFKRDCKGWIVGLAVQVAEQPLRAGRRYVGIDLGIANFAVLSDGGLIPSLKAARRAARRVRVLQRSLERKKRASNGWQEARSRLNRCHREVARARTNHLHQASARLIRDYDVIVVEHLDVQALSRSMLAGDIRDAGWGRFLFMLRYKAERAGALVMEVEPDSTSQDCSSCGMRVGKSLNDRLHDCRHCGLQIDRDLNAARNILGRAGLGPGLRNVADEGKRAGENIDLTTSAA